MKLKNMRPCKVLQKNYVNAYDLERLVDIDISPIFNVVDIDPYLLDDTIKSRE